MFDYVLPGMQMTSHRRLRALSALVLVACLHRSAEAQDDIVIRAGRLLDPATGAVTTNQTIRVRGTRIVSVGAPVATPPGATVVDLSGFTVMPGLIDAHVHLAIGGLPAANALADGRAGVTTIMDLGSRTNRMLRIRDSVNTSMAPGPRVLASGIWIGASSGVCEFNGIGITNGTEGFRARARENLAAGANVLKVCLSSWPGVVHAFPDSVEATTEALDAVVAEARAAGTLVVAHAIGRAAATRAVRAGVSGLAHAAYIDSSLAAEMRRRGTFIISTIASLASDDSPASRDLKAALALAHRAGVPIVMGTDGGVLPHGQSATELIALQAIGLSPLEALRAATSVAARALGIADSVGAIAPGMSADLIATEGDPLRDLDVLRRPRYVMSRGRAILVLGPR